MYDTDNYSSPSDTFADSELQVPQSLKLLMNELIVKGKKINSDQIHKKCTVINHAIISNVRPRSFISSFQVALAVYIHKHVGSRHLVNILNALGLCASYTQAQRFEASAISCGSLTVYENAFKQFAFDNADYNVCSLDGLNIFHGMEGILSISPHSAVEKAGIICTIETNTDCR